MKVQNLTPLSLSVFIFALARERSFIKTHSTERRRVIGQENIVCRCIHAAFSPEISQAGAVKGLKATKTAECCQQRAQSENEK